MRTLEGVRTTLVEENMPALLMIPFQCPMGMRLHDATSLEV